MKLRSNRAIFLLLGTLIAVYAGLTLLLPPDPSVLERFDLTITRLRWIQLSIVIPLSLIWAAAFFGFSRLKSYAVIIRKTKDGKALIRISSGLAILALGSPISSIINSIRTYASWQNPSLKSALTVSSHYLQLILALIAFYFIYQGAKQLKEITKKEPAEWKYMGIVGAVLILATIFSYLALTNPSRSIVEASQGQSAYALPDWLVVASIILPYVFTWYLGMRAAVFIHLYQANVPGVIYRRSFNYLALGIATVVLSSVLTQFLTALGVATEFKLGALLVLIYCLLAVIAAGYLLVAFGVRKLKYIEEV